MPTFEIVVEAGFAAAHRLRMYDGQWEPLHGHNWKVAVCLAAPRLDEIGVVADFTLVRARLDDALGRMHNRCLNELPEYDDRNPSAEHVALNLYHALGPGMPAGTKIAWVRVWETDDCSAICRGGERD